MLPLYCRWPDAKKREQLMARRRGKAAIAVRNAVANGLLPHHSKMRCVDCGRKADCYDHRDYRKPLDVDPVCKSCDAVRGAGAPYDGRRRDWNARMLISRARREAQSASKAQAA